MRIDTSQGCANTRSHTFKILALLAIIVVCVVFCMDSCSGPTAYADEYISVLKPKTSAEDKIRLENILEESNTLVVKKMAVESNLAFTPFDAYCVGYKGMAVGVVILSDKNGPSHYFVNMPNMGRPCRLQ